MNFHMRMCMHAMHMHFMLSYCIYICMNNILCCHVTLLKAILTKPCGSAHLIMEYNMPI